MGAEKLKKSLPGTVETSGIKPKGCEMLEKKGFLCIKKCVDSLLNK